MPMCRTKRHGPRQWTLPTRPREVEDHLVASWCMHPVSPVEASESHTTKQVTRLRTIRAAT